jgi:hypothetical protein
MKRYVMTTGTVFALITVVHAFRVIDEGLQLLKDPLWMLITAVTAALAVWAWRVLRQSA